jgi:archaellum biogenesis protein FlaJ (TadC family)
MKDWEFAGLSFGGWIILIIWFFSGGLITAFLASYHAEYIRKIGEYADASPAYWKVAVTVLVCVLIWIVIAALLIKAGRKSISAMLVLCVFFTFVCFIVHLAVLSEMDNKAHEASWHEYHKQPSISEHNPAIQEVIANLE